MDKITFQNQTQAEQTVTFLKTWKNTDYVGVISGAVRQTSATGDRSAWFLPLSTTQASLAGNFYSTGAFWVARGYLAKGQY